MATPTVSVNQLYHINGLVTTDHLTDTRHDVEQFVGCDVTVIIFVEQSEGLAQRYTQPCTNNKLESHKLHCMADRVGRRNNQCRILQTASS